MKVLNREEMKSIKGGDTACLICHTSGGHVYEFHYEDYYQIDPGNMCQLELGGVGYDESQIGGNWGICPSYN